MNKKKIWLLLIILMLFSYCDESCLNLSTNYFDLPYSKKGNIARLFDGGRIDKITEKNSALIKEFIQNKILGLKNPLNRNIHTSYFWNVYLALPEFVHKDERHSGYYLSEKSFSSRDRLLAYTIYRIDRSPENLKKNYQCLREYIFENISYEYFKRSKAESFVMQALRVHDFLTENIPNYKDRLLSFYSRYYNEDGRMKIKENQEIAEKINSAYGFSAYDLSEKISEELNISRYSTVYSSLYLSFWMRRIHEGNENAVYYILKDVQKHYERQD